MPKSLHKIQKLSNAIKTYHGLHNRETGKFFKAPAKDKVHSSRIKKWCRLLQLDVKSTFERIEQFKNVEQFHTFLKELEDE